MTLDTFKSLLDGLIGNQSSFLQKEQESVEKTFLWRRISFSMLVCPNDHFRHHLPFLQKALVESLKSFSDDLHSEAFLFLRVLLVKISPRHMVHFWALILSALVNIIFLKSRLTVLQEHYVMIMAL